MAVLSGNTQIANRHGLNVRFYNCNDTANALLTVDFANISAISLDSDTAWATGGQAKHKKVGFINPYVGSFKISTQMVTMGLLSLLSGGMPISGQSREIVFRNAPLSPIRYFTIIADTVWQDAHGNIYGEQLIFHKVRARRAINISYSGDGDPVSFDIEFDIAADAYGRNITRGVPRILVVGDVLLTTAGNYIDIEQYVISSGVSVSSETLIMEG